MYTYVYMIYVPSVYFTYAGFSFAIWSMFGIIHIWKETHFQPKFLGI